MDNRLYFIEALFNKNYKENLQLVNKDGETFSFKKIAVKKYAIYDKEITYCVLQLLTPIENVEKDSFLLYRVDIDKIGNASLRHEYNPSIMQDVLTSQQ